MPHAPSVSPHRFDHLNNINMLCLHSVSVLTFINYFMCSITQNQYGYCALSNCCLSVCVCVCVCVRERERDRERERMTGHVPWKHIWLGGMSVSMRSAPYTVLSYCMFFFYIIWVPCVKSLVFCSCNKLNRIQSS
jgi:hypothetical protein